MIVKALRVVVGQLVVFISFLTRPSPMRREPAAQAEVNDAASALALYQFNGCPFCVKVRRTLRRLNLPVELRDASGNAEHRQTLLAQGGKVKVPTVDGHCRLSLSKAQECLIRRSPHTCH